MSDIIRGLRIGFAVTGSFCTIGKALRQADILREMGAELVPVMSEHAASTDTRFGTAQETMARLRDLSSREVITTISGAEPIGPNSLTDIMVVAPCTSNTAAKLANSVTDTSVTMAVKSHLRTGKPVLLAIASNDSLLGSARNIGELFNRKSYYFVPMLQDDTENKPASLVAEFSMLPQAVEAAMKGIQLRPMICSR